MSDQKQIKRLFICVGTVTCQRGIVKDIQSFAHVTLVRNANEARGEYVEKVLTEYPGHVVEGRIGVDCFPDDIVMDAARELGMKNA